MQHCLHAQKALHSSQALNSGHTSTFSVWMVESYNLLTQFVEHPSSKMCMARPRDLEPPWWCSFSVHANQPKNWFQATAHARVFCRWHAPVFSHENGSWGALQLVPVDKSQPVPCPPAKHLIPIPPAPSMQRIPKDPDLRLHSNLGR